MNKRHEISLGLFLGLAVIGAGCSSSQSPDSAAAADATADLHTLYDADVAGFARIDSNSFAVISFDAENDRLFTKIFGGTDSSSVEQYYQARVHYAFTMDDLNQATIVPEQFPRQGWIDNPDSDPSPERALSAQPDDSEHKVEVGAVNISTLFWLKSVVADTPVSLTVNGQSIPITSSRTGVILLGDGYKSTISDSDGNSFPLPPEYRQAILVHEGRHSDCTGGLSAREIGIMRDARSSSEFHKRVPLPHCGHTHIICPSGTYKGIAACDAERYGAYKVGAVYAEAMIDAQTDDIARKILQISAIDNESRYLETESQAPDERTPNMTSDGVIP